MIGLYWPTPDGHKVAMFLEETALPYRRDFVWRLSDNEYSDLDAKLEALESVLAGHQYFPLPGTSSKLMVSVGEYSDHWWQQDA